MRKTYLTFLPLFSLLFILACRLLQPAPTASPAGTTQTAEPAATSTPAAQLDHPAEVSVIATPTPTPAGRAVEAGRTVPEGRVLILVLGSDFRPRKGYRTDVVMLLTVDTHKRTVTAVSFPRDLYVEIEGWERNRINTAFPRGGFDLLAGTFEDNFGVRPDFYVMANMQAFTEIVDSLDGVTVEVGQRLRDKCDRSLDLADDEGYCLVEPGQVEMDGGTALWYVRSRYSTSDFDRLRRAQEVLIAIFSKLMSLNAIAHWPNVFADYEEHVRTNIEIGDIVPLLPVGVQIYREPSRISRFAITRTEVTPFRSPTGASVLLPDYRKIGEIIDQAVFAP